MLAMRQSRWEFNTSAGGNASLGSLAFSKGIFVLDDPSGIARKFEYTGMGLGESLALGKLLHVPKINLPKITIKSNAAGGTGSTVDFNSYGTVFMTDAIPRKDLRPEDFEGGTLYLEGGLGYLLGIGGSILLAGIDPRMLQLSIVHPSFLSLAFKSAKALVSIAGVNEGLQDNIGLSAMIGAITYRGVYETVTEP